MQHIQFGFIVVCFIIAAYYKRPWPALFTAGADLFLVIMLWDEIGVTVFIAAHLCYIVRFSGNKKLLPFCALFIIPAAFLAWLSTNFDLPSRITPYLVFMAVVYAQCFGTAIFLALKGFITKSFPKKNGAMIAAGMLLFAMCDICVLIYSLRLGSVSSTAHSLIWVFYAPSQLLLALSAKGFVYSKAANIDTD